MEKKKFFIFLLAIIPVFIFSQTIAVVLSNSTWYRARDKFHAEDPDYQVVDYSFYSDGSYSCYMRTVKKDDNSVKRNIGIVRGNWIFDGRLLKLTEKNGSSIIEYRYDNGIFLFVSSQVIKEGKMAESIVIPEIRELMTLKKRKTFIRDMNDQIKLGLNGMD